MEKQTRRTIRNVGVLVLLTVLVSFGASYIAENSELQPVTPFTVKFTKITQLRDRAEVKHNLYALKSDGSSAAWDERDIGLGPAMVKTIRDIQRREAVTYEPNVNGKVTTPLSEKDIRVAQMTRTSCVEPNQEFTEEKFLGFDVLRTTHFIPEHKVKLEKWIAPSLNCYPIKDALYTGQGSDWKMIGHSEATEITLGEPSPELFAVPPDYREMPRVELFQEMKKRVGQGHIPPSPTGLYP